MNEDQAYGYVRTVCTMISAIAGFSAAQSTQVMQLGLGAVSAVFLGISLYGTWKANSAKAKLASVAAMPEVAKVTMVPSPAGEALAKASPDKVTT